MQLYKVLIVLALGTAAYLPAALAANPPPIAAATAAKTHQPMRPSAGKPMRLAAKDTDLPLSRDALFDLDEPKRPAPGKAAPPPGDDALPGSLKDLLGEDAVRQPGAATPQRPDLPALGQPVAPGIGPDASGIRGYLQTELAYTYGEPEHWSKTLARLHLATGGQRAGVKWKLSARLDYNAVYDLTGHYPKAVRDDDRLRLLLHETYVDFATGEWDWRVGRQNVVWGEMVGLFFADVVSAKDLREFVLPDFQIQRIPQWAVRAERGFGDSHLELIWIPYPSYDQIGKPGGDFYPYPPLLSGLTPVIEGERKPARQLKHSNYGLRLGRLIDGWDLSAFYYNSLDAAAIFPRELGATTQTYRPSHARIWQAGGTLGKDLGPFVLKAELIYTDGRKYNTVNPADADGLVVQDTLDWVLGADFQPGPDTRLNTQLFQRIYFDHDPGIIPARRESGASLLVNHKFGGRWEGEALYIRSLNRNDWLLRPKLVWKPQTNWRMTLGVDVFQGPATGFFGRFDNRDRGYAELRYDF
jgi:hypothetical protein